MLVRLIGCFMIAAVTAEVAVTGHDLLRTSSNPGTVALAERVMPLDETDELRSAAENPEQARAHLLAAVKENPYDGDTWVRLSVDAESSGNNADAERYLKEALAHDSGSAPRWAAANFYFRHGDQSRFLQFSNSYRERTHEGEAGLFRMAAELTPDPHELLAELPRMHCDELGTLIGTLNNRQVDPEPVVDRMTSDCHDTASHSTLSHIVTDLLASDKPVAANHIWLQMGEHAALANANFSQPVTGEGFDWRINQSHEVAVRQPENQGIRLEFGDDVASGTVLLFQPIALEAGKPYRLNMNFEADPPEQDAFRWELVELSTGRHLASGLDTENINQQAVWKFEAPDSQKTVALALFYARPTGSTPFQGTMQIHGIQLAQELIPQLSFLPAKHVARSGY